MSKFSHMSHGLGDHATGHTHPGNKARDGAPKRVTPIKYHDGMTRQQQDVAGIGGLARATMAAGGGHAIASSADASPLLPHAYSGQPDMKRGKSVPVHPSHSRGAVKDEAMRQLGDQILREAILRGGK
jgi:hypothetical protein